MTGQGSLWLASTTMTVSRRLQILSKMKMMGMKRSFTSTFCIVTFQL